VRNLGVFVGEDKSIFFYEILDHLKNQFNVKVFKRRSYNVPILYGRLNRWALNKEISSLLSQNDVCFFEWASDLLALASHMDKRSAIITRLHSFELFEWAPKINWQFVDIIILVSQTMQRRFNDLYPAQSHKTIVVHNGISLERFGPSESHNFHFVFGMLCNITPIKRIYDVILMLDKLRENGFLFKLYIGGEPTCGEDYRYFAAIHGLVEKLNLGDFVVFDGYIKDTPAWLKKIDIFISNSYWEGQQVALLEAMASGCYCLSHNWDGVEEILPNENIFITETEFIRKAIDFYEKSASEKVSCQELMRRIAVAKFDIKRTQVQIQQIIEKTKASK
jgi:glycosyltransferase involved in cell wall biosynthesis